MGAAAITLAGVQLGGALARVVAGAWSDRLAQQHPPSRALALAGAASLALAAALLWGPTPPPPRRSWSSPACC